MTKKIFFACQLPPPLHGMSNVNMHVLQLLEQHSKDWSIEIINTTRSRRKIARPFSRALKSISICLKLLLNIHNRKNTIYYMAASGGLGLAYEVVPWLLAGMCAKKRMVHHHSFNYCYKRSMFMFLMQWFGRSRTTNIFLCNKHKDMFCTTYRIEIKNNQERLLVVPNDFIFSDQPLQFSPAGQKHYKVIIGHLSNLSIAKGFRMVLEVFEAIKQNRNIVFEIVGPTDDAEIIMLIKKYQTEYPDQFIYHGPLYNEQKQEWFTRLDFFLFPSTYHNEAYPLVVVEAINANAIALTTTIGCLSEINNSEFMFEPDEYVAKTVPFINKFASNERVRESIIEDIGNLNIRNRKKIEMSEQAFLAAFE